MGVHNRNKQYGFASVQPRNAQIVRKNRIINKKVLIIGAVILALVAVAWGVSAFLKSDLDSKIKAGVVELFKKDEIAVEETNSIIQLNKQEDSKNPAAVVLGTNFSNTQKVKIALLASPDLFDYRNHKKIGCDALVFAETEITKTPKVLNSTLTLLFNDDFDYGFPPANFISSTQNKLTFDSAVINNGVAQVFLKGEMTISDSSCDKNRIGYQIKETAMQFATVKSVEIYLNGQKIEL